MMATDPFSSELYGELFGGVAAHRLFTDTAEIAAMLRFEAALARAQARLGIIPAEPGAELAEALERITIEPAVLAAGVASSGMPVPALVAELRRRLPPELAQWVHFGATSQDAIDTALMLRLKALFEALEGELATLRVRLAGLADAHRRTPIVARTRWQQAAPTSFGLKVATWLDPLNRLFARLAELRPRVLAVQCGGAAGNLAQIGADGPRLIEALADELGLSPALPWHSTRDRVVEAGDWLAALAGVLGTIGTDLVLMAQ
jgi:3-carboxy-cis,cis-muconate cycloisomerase